jgi:hypothetical protein
MPMIEPKAVPALLQRSCYDEPIVSIEKIELQYDNLKMLFDDLKNAGQLNYLKDKSNTYVGKDYFLKVEELYFERYQKNNKIFATFEFIVMLAL